MSDPAAKLYGNFGVNSLALFHKQDHFSAMGKLVYNNEMV